MTFRMLSLGDPGWDEAVQFAEAHLERALENTSYTRIGILTGEGGTWNEATEEMEGRDVVAVLTMDMGRRSPIVAIVVRPDHRRHGLATRMLRWLASTQFRSFRCQADLRNQGGLAFAARHGTFQRRDNNLLTFECSATTLNIPHLGCPCQACEREMEMFDTSMFRY